jgi:molecular chaperone GrpE
MSDEKQMPEETSHETEKITQELEEEKKLCGEYLNRLKYLQADFDNYRKRVERQLEDIKRYSNERFIIEMLEVVDELEIAVKAGRDSNSTNVLIEGVEMTLKKIQKILINENVRPVECLEKPFDPSKCNAVATVEKEDVEEGTVVEEIRKGYIMNDKIIRPSIVKVTIKPCVKKEEMKGDLDE